MPKRIVVMMTLLELALTVSVLTLGFQPANACRCRLLGDANKDGKVDGEDLLIVARALGSYGRNFLCHGSSPHPRWNPAADVNRDNKIDGYDLALVAMNFGKTSS